MCIYGMSIKVVVKKIEEIFGLFDVRLNNSFWKTAIAVKEISYLASI